MGDRQPQPGHAAIIDPAMAAIRLCHFRAEDSIMTTPLWVKMMKAENEAFCHCQDLNEADRLSRAAAILAVRDYLPIWEGSQPYRILTEEARLAAEEKREA
jgi:hypothetical protein